MPEQVVRTHTFIGKTYRIVEGVTAHDENGQPVHGYCECPETKKKELVAPVSGGTVHDLEIILHEALHACFWWLSEYFVAWAARDLARFLWRLGWRNE